MSRLLVRSSSSVAAAARRSSCSMLVRPAPMASMACAAAAAPVPAPTAARRMLHVSAVRRIIVREGELNEKQQFQVVPKLLDAILFDLFAHKFPESAVFTPSHPLDASAGNAEAEAAARVDDSLPFTSLGLDSLDVVELLVAVEKNFGVELADEEHESVKNVNDLIEKIYNHPRAA